MIPVFIDTAANSDKFVVIQTPRKGWYTISVQRDGYASGGGSDATITIKASNYDDIPTAGVDNFAEFSTDTTDVPVTKNIDIPNYGFQYLAIEYKSNSATGTIQVYINEPPA